MTSGITPDKCHPTYHPSISVTSFLCIKLLLYLVELAQNSVIISTMLGYLDAGFYRLYFADKTVRIIDNQNISCIHWSVLLYGWLETSQRVSCRARICHCIAVFNIVRDPAA